MIKYSIFPIVLAIAAVSMFSMGSTVMAQQANPAQTEESLFGCADVPGMLIAQGGPMMGPEGDRDDGRHHGRRMFGDPGKMRRDLNLTDDQFDKIEAINDKYFEEHRKIRDKIHPKLLTLRDLLKQDKVDLDKVRAVLKEIGDYQIESRMIMIRQHLEIESVLTKEQRDKVRRDRREIFERGMMRGW